MLDLHHVDPRAGEGQEHLYPGPSLRHIGSSSYTIDVRQVERTLTANTRAILPVHIYGAPSAVASAGILLGLWVDRCL